MWRFGLHPGVYGASIGLLITGGLAVLSATPVQLGIFWLGVGAIALGILLLIWGLKIDGEHWWKSRKSNLKRIGLNEAVRRVAYESEWAMNFAQGSFEYVALYVGDPWKSLMREICRPLTLGDIRSWGVKIERNKVAENGPTEIPKEYWTRAAFNPELMLTEPSINSVGGGEAAPIYERVQLDCDGVDAAWPRLGRRHRKRARFHALYAEWRTKWDAGNQEVVDWINQSALTPTADKPRWTMMDDAIRYIANDSAWSTLRNRSDPMFPVHVSLQLQDALASGEIVARGRTFHALQGGVQDPPLHPLTVIPVQFWKDGRVDAYWPMNGRVQTIASGRAESAVRKGNHEGMHDIQLPTAELEKLWPVRVENDD